MEQVIDRKRAPALKPVWFTALGVAAIKPKAKRYEIPDEQMPGLYLVVHPSGKKSWVVRYRRQPDRKHCKLTLPGSPSLAEAHKLASEALAKVKEGEDPAARKQEAKRKASAPDANLVEAAFKSFLERHVRKKNGRPIRESTRVETARLLGFKRGPAGEWVEADEGRGVLSHWKGRRIDTITKADVHRLLDELVATGPVTANRKLTALRTCFAFHVERDALPKSPCDGVRRPTPEASRERVLADAELAALWRAADAEGYPYGPMVQLLALTGCRRDEVRDAVWPEFDLDERVWAIPGERTKNGSPHVVPLSDAAVAILAGLPRIAGEARLLFTTTGDTPISGLSKIKARVEKAMAKELEYEPARWTLHDLRRTFVTGLQRLRFPVEVAEASVNHRSGTMSGVTGVYARHGYGEEKRRAFDAWALGIDRILAGKPLVETAEVIELRRA